MNRLTYFILVGVVSISCNSGNQQFDATGNFEADETIVSAEGNGKLLQFNCEEGQHLKKGEVIGYIDTTQLHLMKRQLEYSITAIRSRKPDVEKQLLSLKEKIDFTIREKNRFERLLEGDAATQKQVDDLSSQLEVLLREYSALESSLQISTNSIEKETLPIRAQIEQINDQIKKSVVISPVNGMVLTKYAEPGELAVTGRALFKMADLTVINLRAYVSGSQLPSLKLGQDVSIKVDANADDYTTHNGKIIWVSDKAEFTPKTIQTKEERANLVYAIKIAVKNDGTLKIGMYGEVLF
ncbi:MAG: HlyD family efflux transporter periplasmic adaptor subunit [Flammeovirgaceae bacterium]|nr:HlyD family efflux transporter periplasmic adaptor subunit [Flammeovirgaceae bacterium]